MKRALLLFLVVTACHQAPEPLPAPQPAGVAHVLRAAAALVDILPRETKPACVAVTAVGAVLNAAAAVVEAPSPTLPPIELDLSRCALRPVELDEGVISTVTAVIDVARAGLALSDAHRSNPVAASAADQALAYARELLPQLLELAAGDVATVSVPARPLAP